VLGDFEPTARTDPSASQRFTKLERLTTRREYLLVQQQGTRIHLRDLLVFVHPRAGERRIGITASRKVGGAVVRNRLKRLLREAWRRERGRLPLGHDIVFVAKRSAAGIALPEVLRQFAELARRLSRWRVAP
jgi:ribonuclease P protein component